VFTISQIVGIVVYIKRLRLSQDTTTVNPQDTGIFNVWLNLYVTWLITGGAGYIGAHVVQSSIDSGRDILVLDDLSTGIASRLDSRVQLVQTSLQNVLDLDRIFSDAEITGVLHLAAKKRVGESVEKPDYYWQENVGGLKNLLDAMKKHGVQNLVFSSSAAVYGQPDVPAETLITEETECNPINPYGSTKLEGEFLSRSMAESDGLKVAALRYFNVAGAGRPELGDRYKFNLVPIAFDALDRGEHPVVFGDDYNTPDGSCIRDYVHVQDLAEAHVAAMEAVEKSEPGFSAINIGTGIGASVFEVLNKIEDVTGINIAPVHVSRRVGDPPALVADVLKAKEVLNWSSERDLGEIVESAWDAWQFNKK
jgi:UDP-glucose 4-epimerase